MISIGKLIALVNGDIGWAIIGNLHILFAVAIGGSRQKTGRRRFCSFAFFCFKGRAGDYTDEENTAEQPASSTASALVAEGTVASSIISLLGGSENIEDVDACMTRLRVTVKDTGKVSGEAD